MRRSLALVCLLLSAAAGAAEQNLLFILDASGSMWGRIDDTPKISVAKEVMGGLIKDLPEGSRAGLLAYGHRRKGDCADIESLVSLGPLDRERLVERIQGLSPKGKTPITAAVEQAVAQLRPLESAASVVLVSDGLESCGGDPCEAVKAARRSGVDFRLHVVGFGLGETDAGQLQCMAAAGGGAYHTAANAEELSRALQKAVQVKPGLILEVTRNGKPTPARVFVYRAGTEQEVERDTLGASAEDRDPNPLRIGLDPGEYDFRVVSEELDGDAERLLTGITVPEEGETRRTVDFASGDLALTVTANGSGIKARTYVYQAGTDHEAARAGTGEEGRARHRLAPGTYDVRVRPGSVSAPDRRLEGVTVAAGETTSRSVDFSSGSVQVRVTANGEPLDARTYIQYADSGREAARDSTDREGKARYTVPVGEYRIRIRPDGIDAPDRVIENVRVTAGGTTRKHVDYASGSVVVEVTTNGEPLDARTYIQHADTGKEAARDGTNSKGIAGYTVPVGTYRIKVRPDGISAPDRYIEDVVVRAGETTRKRIDIASGTVEVSVTHKGEPLDARTYILHADTGKEAARDGTNSKGIAGYTVPVGTYRIKVRPDGIDAPDRFIEDVKVTAGSTTRASLDLAEP